MKITLRRTPSSHEDRGPNPNAARQEVKVANDYHLITHWRVRALSDPQREQFRRHHFGFIFQGYNLFPALTARQQLELVLRWGEGTPAREARCQAERMLAQLGLGNKMALRLVQLSGGEKQRVAIGRALVKEPALCFADEPTSALDWAHGQEVVELLRAAAKQRGATVLVVTHDSRLVPYADRVLHMDDGCLAELASGTPRDPDRVVSHPDNYLPELEFACAGASRSVCDE